MARPPKGKPLTYRPIRLDDDVWKECQRLGKEHGTINEGLRAKLFEHLLRKDIGKHFAPEPLENSPPVVGAIRQKLGMKPRPFKSPLLKPSEKKGK